jgi:hypothetical protein
MLCVTLRCVTLRYVTLRCVAVRFVVSFVTGARVRLIVVQGLAEAAAGSLAEAVRDLDAGIRFRPVSTPLRVSRSPGLRVSGSPGLRSLRVSGYSDLRISGSTTDFPFWSSKSCRRADFARKEFLLKNSHRFLTDFSKISHRLLTDFSRFLSEIS